MNMFTTWEHAAHITATQSRRGRKPHITSNPPDQNGRRGGGGDRAGHHGEDNRQKGNVAGGNSNRSDSGKGDQMPRAGQGRIGSVSAARNEITADVKALLLDSGADISLIARNVLDCCA
ncbi:hypothetical protein PHMEG_00028333 [Phytophthora megakarya]|uniref:Uncharacterized protein n=1 Tax=Phytophthora megakarya TaxID=4795 RepID=A0A225V6E8_9STRA|nr:hypothetical protein PHMEG_00028333 [Phytophthora megakarya]